MENHWLVKARDDNHLTFFQGGNMLNVGL